jgi:2Fe-2S ferredoxin
MTNVATTAVTVTDRSGQRHELLAEPGWTLMETIRDAGIPDILALCGGCASCATCHVYIDAVWTEQVGVPTGDEDELLNSSDHRRPESRLSCQIQISPALDGLRAAIAPED